MNDAELVAKWEAKATELEQLGALVDGARLCRVFLSDLVAAKTAATRDVLSLAQASEWSGYSKAHLARLVKEGKLKTLRPIGSRGRLISVGRTFRGSRGHAILRSRVYTSSPAASTEARSAVMAHPECWSRSLGTQGEARVRVYERHPGSTLYISVWLPGEGERRRSLGHRDKQRALQEARGIVALRTQPRLPRPQPVLTLGTLFGRYLSEGKYLPDGSLKTDAYLRHVRKTGEHLARHFGEHRPVTELTPDRMREYVRRRREGEISGHPAGANTIQRDLGMLKAALNWACTVYEGGRPLLERNPLDKVRFPRERDPKRPVLANGTMEGLCAIAPQVHPFLRPLLVLARRTGRRLNAILQLRWDDIDFERSEIRWRAAHDKMRRTWTVPMHSEVRAVLVQHRRNQSAIGTSLLFPHPRPHRHPDQPVTRHLAAWWLKEAFRKAKLAKPEGSLWHMFRRAWATDRKHLPPKDVAAAGGWLDIGTLQHCYQQPDPQTLREVVEYQRVEPAHRSVGRRPRPIGAWRRSRELRLDSHRNSHSLQIGEARQR